MNTERTVDYQIDDNRLVGKVIVFSNKKITSTIDGFGSCKQPNYHNTSVKISTYVDSIMSNSDGSHFSDYTFNIPGDTRVNSYQITCHSGDISNSDTGESVEPAIYKDKLFMDWVDGTFLILERSDK
ncbi:hypothetical protein DT73_20780 [Mangrovibacter sp. MFB070]|uniref:hypothetical protein n=1 Tax=Mangrovibacter sp. MFB070 TaxID=1224318 RepID=UPI0004D8C0E7|nr:hypothetical protein [Mangrovibacter sp. MFB070]KEA50877.1 hypothetical protein DT73_20780 [Mangrovibacter sp. MFB070]